MSGEGVLPSRASSGGGGGGIIRGFRKLGARVGKDEGGGGKKRGQWVRSAEAVRVCALDLRRSIALCGRKGT